MRRTRVGVAVISTVAFAVAGTGAARAMIDRDFAVGGGQSAAGQNFGLSAHSGPIGEDAFGHVSTTVPDDGKFRARIVCLMVSTDMTTGVKRAGFIGEITESESNTFPAGVFVRGSARDTGLPGGSGDGFRFGITSIPPDPTVCPPQNVPNIEHGNINIHDAQP